ncbi:MAG: type II secretion system F family protein [Candidatus Pacebacteria bacterium]|nr:type II secretion system F family protein [Candidatus Paceibacterota bacterium]
MFGATFVMGAGLALYILPKLIPLFSQLRVTLPLATRILLATVAFAQNYWYLIIIGAILLYFGFKALNKIRSVRKFLHIVYLKTPIVGSIITSYQLALVTRLFEILIKSGVPLRDSIDIISEAVTNVNYEDSLRAMNERVKGGTPLSETMIDYPNLYPKNLVSIIATGEKSGTMEDSLGYLANHYIKEVQLKTKQLPTILEPALLVFIGIVVGFIAIAIIMPIYSLTSGVLK